MLILNMILKITGFTQEKLANFIGVSRASINSWLIDDSSMSINSKQSIADKFQFPVSYFNIDLDQDLNIYKVVFSTLYESWKRINVNIVDDNPTLNKINRIINDIESDFKQAEKYEFSESEIIEGLVNGYDPFTGEVFDERHILNNEIVKNIMQRLKTNQKYGFSNITKEDLNSEQLELFENLRKWRREKYIEEGYFNAYIVFNDRELFNIILANIKRKEDLKKVKGIGEIKYNKYADDLFSIINGEYKFDEKNNNYYNNRTSYDEELPF